MEVLLKGSCDACTSSKVKCSGGNPCNRCKSRDIVCSYRPKRKRGPQKGSKSSNKRALAENGFSFISTYERRVWSVFFTMFKNQNRTRSDAVWAWCWFASQLEKLKTHLTTTGNQEAITRLHAWLEALDVDIQAVVGGMKTKCQFSPSMCGTCSAIAMCVPEDAQPPKDTVIQALHIGKEFGISQNDKPRLVMDCFDGGVLVQVNQAFEDEFGISGQRFGEILEWSAGGFLPWGGDILAKLLVKESDLHVFLQILAIKASSLGPPEHKSKKLIEREVPSTHIFDLWCIAHPGETQPSMVRPFMLNCINIERIKDDKMTTQLKIAFESVGERREPKAGEEPVSCEETNKGKKPLSPQASAPQASAPPKRLRADASAPVKAEPSGRSRNTAPATHPRLPQAAALDKEMGQHHPPPPPPQHHEQPPAPPHLQSRQSSLPDLSRAASLVDEMPAEAAKYYDNWAYFDPLASEVPIPSNAQGIDDRASFPSSPPTSSADNLPFLDSLSRTTSRSSIAPSARNGKSGPQHQHNHHHHHHHHETPASVPAKGYAATSGDPRFPPNGSASFNDDQHQHHHQNQPEAPGADNDADMLIDDGEWLDSILEWSAVNTNPQNF